jgi:hypothetical protein
MKTDRDKLRDEIERMCIIDGKTFEEKLRSITVIPGGPKFLFNEEGELKSVTRDGVSYTENGVRK